MTKRKALLALLAGAAALSAEDQRGLRLEAKGDEDEIALLVVRLDNLIGVKRDKLVFVRVEVDGKVVAKVSLDEAIRVLNGA